MTDHPDFLRSPSKIFDPDPRSTGFAVLGDQGFRPIILEDQYESVAQITLHDGVPREIVVKFETAKNLNLFSWFVFRFHLAARSHAYECLELSLRMLFKDALYEHEEQKRRALYEQKTKSQPQCIKPFRPVDKEKFRPTLHPLLKYAIEIGAVKNENFSVWQQKTRVRARSRRDIEIIQTMNEMGLSEYHVDDGDIEIKDEDRDHDYLSQLLASVPFIRNHYAHGTSALDNKSLSDLRIVSEIINQIFPPPATVQTETQR